MPPRQRPELPDYFQWIDAVRGLAALSVVVFHYHHFYLADNLSRPDMPAISEMPYSTVLWPLYEHGDWAVRLFWVISGFVFAHVYFDRVVSAWNFLVARIARLYPLHALTLLYMAGLQMLSMSAVGHWQIYGNNDLQHFARQLFFASDALKASRGLSFNGPIWSVSVEMGAYALFFASLVLLRRLPIAVPAIFLAAGFFLAQSGWDIPLISFTLFTCIGFFFSGTALYGLYLMVGGRTLPMLAVAAILAIVAYSVQDWLGSKAMLALGSAAVVAALAAIENKLPSIGQSLRPLGDISYSLYLVHVPIQATLLLFADMALGGTRGFAESWWLLPAFTCTSVIVAHLVYRHFERPTGKAIRRALLQRT